MFSVFFKVIMTQTKNLWILCFWINLCLSLGFAADKPNVLFIFADDHCYEALGAMGSEVKTPHLDQLIREGTQFNHTYNMGAWNGAVCVASRHMITTGRHLWNAFKASNNMQEEVKAGRTWPQMMQKAGYQTYMTGKWHVKAKPDEIFNVVEDVRGGMPNQTPEGYNRPKSPEDYESGWKPWDKQYGGFWKGGRHWSEVVADHGENFLKIAANDSKPFFMYLAFNAPHDPRQAPKKFVDMYPLDKIKLPVNFLPEYPYAVEMGSPPGLRDEKLAPFPRTDYNVKVNRQEYYALITHMDVQIGRILKTLKESGQEDNTYVVFTADHGLGVGQHGLLGKQNMFDHSMRVPFVIKGPNIPKGKKINTPIYLQDVVATSLELAKTKKPKHVEFKSVLPLIRGDSTQQYEYIYGAYRDQQYMIRQEQFKVIHYPAAKKFLMFNIEKDPHEMNDLSGSKEVAYVYERLKQQLSTYLKANNAKQIVAKMPKKAKGKKH